MKMNIEKFNKQNLTQLRIKMNALLKESGFDNVEFNIGNIKFSENDCKITVEAKISGKQTQKEVFSSAILDSVIASRKLQKSVNGYELVDYLSTNWKMPFIYTHAGKRYKCSEERAIQIFGAK